MGLRGPHANVRPNQQQPTDELVISDEALRIYRRMRRLERQCTCPSDEECEHWEKWWAQNQRLAAMLGLACWEYAFVNPQWGWPRTRQSEVDRFWQFEKAAARKAGKPKYKYKWERDA